LPHRRASERAPTFAGKLAKLLDVTLVYPGHDYIENNLRSALDRKLDKRQAKPLLAQVRDRRFIAAQVHRRPGSSAPRFTATKVAGPGRCDWLRGGRTDVTRDLIAEASDPEAATRAIIDTHPIGRMAQPEEVAATIAVRASPDSSFMTGLAIPVVGGRSIR
jgi:hypothetical protein